MSQFMHKGLGEHFNPPPDGPIERTAPANEWPPKPPSMLVKSIAFICVLMVFAVCVCVCIALCRWLLSI